MRRLIIAGNWKLNRTPSETAELVRPVAAAADASAAEVVVCPPFTGLESAVEAARDSGLLVGAQDVFWKDSGAYTGQVSAPMLADLDVSHVIIGHSERRGRFGVPEADFDDEILAHFGDSDATVNRKLHAALRHDLIPIVCCGETLSERRDGLTDSVVQGQVRRALEGVDPAAVPRIVFAYEPVWAIGTGETCPAAEADRVCGVVRAAVEALYGSQSAQAVRVQYGGSVKPGNAAELLAQPNIDGALVGGASLDAEDFAAIIAAATT